MSRFSNPNFLSSPTSSHSSHTISVGSSQSWVPVPINPLHAPRLSPSSRTSKWLTKLPSPTHFATSPRFSHTSSVFSYLKDVPWASPTHSSLPVVSSKVSADPFVNFSGEFTAPSASPVPATPPRVVRPYVQPPWLSKHAADDKIAAVYARVAAREAHAKRQPFKKGWAPRFSTIFCELARLDAIEPETTEVIDIPEVIETTAAESDDDTFDTACLFPDDSEVDDDNETVICDVAEVTQGLSPISADVTGEIPGSWPDEETNVSTPPVAGRFGSWRPAIVAVAVSALLWGVSRLV